MLYVGLSPFPVIVTIRMFLHFLVRDPYYWGRGANPTYTPYKTSPNEGVQESPSFFDRKLYRGKGVAKTITKQRVESHFDLELRAAVMQPGR